MSDDIPPLHLTRQEMEVLLTAVEVCLRLDGSVLRDEEARQMAEEVIMTREGIAGVARADRLLAAARERQTLLWQLREQLGEHLAQFRGAEE